MLNEKKHEFEINGQKAFFSTGLLARRSQSAVLAGMGDTVILATVNTKAAKSDQEYFPMMVEYIEKMYASGKITGSRFVKRDRFPTNDATLRARMIDRSFRPLFPSDYRDEVQIIVKVMSFDEENDPAMLAINAVSAALMLSSAPFDKSASGVRVGLVGDQPFPLYKHVNADDLGDSKLNLVLAGDGEVVANIDANSYEVSDEDMVKSIEFGMDMMKPWLEAQKAFMKVAKESAVEKAEYVSFAPSEDLLKKAQASFGDEIATGMGSDDDHGAMNATLEKMFEEFDGDHSKREVREVSEKVAKAEMKKLVLEEGKRADGRGFDEIRELSSSVGLLPKTHGSGLFTRGMTQVLTTATLGTARNQLIVDDMTGDSERSYMHFYGDEPFSFGDVGRVRYIPGRRGVGHGSLAEKALYPVLPSLESFPYTIILFSEIMSEMGSSSMASISGSTLALMDAGVPITRPVAGIAIGIVYEEGYKKYELLTDMVAVEDFYGGMDFKVGGTSEGITAIQMDTKTKGITMEICKAAIAKASVARETILKSMAEAIDTPRKEMADHAPKVEIVKIPQDKIGEFIGPGGKNIKELQEETGAEFDIQDDGTVNIYATSAEMMKKAKEGVEGYSFVPEIGEVYEGEVTGIKEFGAFVDIARGVTGLVHVSELSDEFVKDVEEHVKMGDLVKVKVIGMDRDKIKMSIKQAT